MTLQRQWQQMLARSFSPRQWFYEKDWNEDLLEHAEDHIMWVYRMANHDTGWEVGYYTPDGGWFKDVLLSTRKEAADRAHWLNGGHVKPDGEPR